MRKNPSAPEFFLSPSFLKPFVSEQSPGPSRSVALNDFPVFSEEVVSRKTKTGQTAFCIVTQSISFSWSLSRGIHASRSLASIEQTRSYFLSDTFGGLSLR